MIVSGGVNIYPREIAAAPPAPSGRARGFPASWRRDRQPAEPIGLPAQPGNQTT